MLKIRNKNEINLLLLDILIILPVLDWDRFGFEHVSFRLSIRRIFQYFLSLLQRSVILIEYLQYSSGSKRKKYQINKINTFLKLWTLLNQRFVIICGALLLLFLRSSLTTITVFYVKVISERNMKHKSRSNRKLKKRHLQHSILIGRCPIAC